MHQKTAIVVGATGATGKHLVDQLLAHDNYAEVVVLARKPLGFEHDKLTAYVIDFDQQAEWQHLVKGDELFSAMGTTLKLAGSKEAQYKVDYGYQLAVATAAKHNGVGKLLLVSSPGANSRAFSFYMKMKGELDDAVRKLGFDQCILIKPSIIEGERAEGRPGEKIGGVVMSSLVKCIPPLRPYRPITGSQLAAAMINIAQQEFDQSEMDIELGDLFDYL